MGTESALPGVTFLDHTADVGLEARAASPRLLFHRAALGALRLVEGPEGESAGGSPDQRPPRSVALEADDLPALLRAWLREILWWHEVDGLAYRDARFSRLEPTLLEARVEVVPARPDPVREIKGVTLHGLAVVEGEDGEWRARVIFDV